MSPQKNNAIKFEKFHEKQFVIRNSFLVLFFIFLFLIIGLMEKNLVLPNDGLGLLEHMNIWTFLFLNLLIPIALKYNFNMLEKNVEFDIFNNVKENFIKNSNSKITNILWNLSATIGFCYFIGNSLQNANIINHLSFDYWDSIKYMGSYIASRFYKLYLFSHFIPYLIIYVLLVLKSVSELLMIDDKEMNQYPIKKYEQLNSLCNFGLNILLIIAIPFALSSGVVYFIHRRLDITTVATILASFIGSLALLCMYIFLINKFYTSIRKYKRKNIEHIDLELSKIHHYILKYKFNVQTYEKLDAYLKKEAYLSQIKENLNKISQFPFVFKAVCTSITPILPFLLKIILYFLKTFFNLDELDAIL